MKNPSNLPKKQLARIVAEVQGILYLEIEGKKQVWNPDKQWDVDFLTMIADVLDAHGLIPNKLGDKEDRLR
jgi:hypothetical protein